MLRRVLGFIVVVVFCACRAESRKQTVETNADIKHVIDSLNTRMAAWYDAGQADSVAMVFAQDAWQMPPNMAPMVGRDSVRAFWVNALKTGKWHFELKGDEVAACDSLAVERGHYTLKVVAGPKAQYPSFEDHGNYVVLWRRDSDGNWKVVWDAPVSTVPMPMPTNPPTAPPKKS